LKKSSHVTDEGQIARFEGSLTLRSPRDDVTVNRRYARVNARHSGRLSLRMWSSMRVFPQ